MTERKNESYAEKAKHFVDPNNPPRDDDPNLNAAKHWLPDYHELPDLSLALETRLTVPISRVNAVREFTDDNVPFDVVASTWRWLNIEGVLTKVKCLEMIDGGLDELAKLINERGEMRAYPQSTFPPTVYGVAYHDWGGATCPFDIRLVMEYKAIEVEVPDDSEHKIKCPETGNLFNPMYYGVNFHLVTMLEKEVKDSA